MNFVWYIYLELKIYEFEITQYLYYFHIYLEFEIFKLKIMEVDLNGKV